MKLAVFALVLGLCLAVNAASVNHSVEDQDIIKFYNSKSSLKETLRTLKGVKCTVEWVLKIRETGIDYLNDSENCNKARKKDRIKLQKQVLKVVESCNDVLKINKRHCNNGDYNAEHNGQMETTKNCYDKLVSEMTTLKKQISKTITLSKEMSFKPGAFYACNLAAFDDLLAVFTEESTFVEKCSKVIR